ncbi:uncharacterized protein LOC132548804 [Ylistrum balloti]|uniref:uncharacterized protein LOC132548804 n=1 Tax=Ylistrum balloti TaxID=509963 RepID=UPI002905EC8C|nr:uncharacterized protein LOC132548804 [Ylistrum balloti]
MATCLDRLFSHLLFTYLTLTVNGQNCPGNIIAQAFHSGQKLSQIFLNINLTGLQQCSHACLLRTKCQVIAFNFLTANCELGENVAYVTPSFSNSTGTILRSTLLQFETFLLESCVGHSCDNDSVCVELSSGTFTCVSLLTYVAPTTTALTTISPETTSTTVPPTTTTTTALPPTTLQTTSSSTMQSTTTEATDIFCGDLLSVPNADTPTSTERSVGTSLSYSCVTGYMLSGNPEVTCQQNGQWSIPALTCVLCETNDFVYNSGHQICYRLQLDTRYVQPNAVLYCSGIGGRLAKVDTTEKIKFLASVLPTFTQVFVDGTDAEEESKWIYSDGSDVNMNLFQGGQPTFNTAVNCMILLSNFAEIGELNCYSARFVICEK